MGTTSDFDGNFELSLNDNSTVLVISYIGFKTQEVDVAGQTSVQITMVTDAASLDEIVVVGYSSQKKATLTGSISTMKGEDIAQVPAGNITQSLAGRMAGVSMRPNGGTPVKTTPTYTSGES